MAFESIRRTGARFYGLLHHRRVYRPIFFCSLLALALMLLWRAWVTEDAFITFRVLDNAVHGYGLRWNIDERVQVYTHPLWMMALLPFYALFGNAYYPAIFLSVGLALLTYALLLHRFRRQAPIVLAAVFVPMLASVAYGQYSVCGLENPLSDFLLIAFFLCYLKPGTTAWRKLSLLGSLILLTRFDLVWFLLPPGIELLIRHRFRLPWRKILLGALPIIAWSGFSLFYYGFFFPNTRYGKLSTGIPLTESMRQGARYFIHYFKGDFAAGMVLAIAFSFTIALFFQKSKSKAGSRPLLAVAGSVVSYLFYLLLIGGDYMGSRFMIAPWLICLYLIALHIERLRDRAARQLLCFVIPAFILILSAWDYSQVRTLIASDEIADEYNFYAATNALLRNLPDNRSGVERFHWAQAGLADRRQAERFYADQHNAPPYLVQARGAAGMTPFYAGPGVVFLDPYGLGDALTARLPVKDKNYWRIGHFYRLMPAGYVHFRETGDLSRMEPHLAAYTAELREITSGPLTSLHRLKTIARFNLGFEDYLLADYLSEEARTVWPLARLDHFRLIDERSEDRSDDRADAGNFIVPHGATYRFVSPTMLHPERLIASVFNGCDLQIDLVNTRRIVFRLPLGDYGTNDDATASEHHVEFALPENLRAEGFDEIQISHQPYSSSGNASCADMPFAMETTVFFLSFFDHPVDPARWRMPPIKD